MYAVTSKDDASASNLTIIVMESTSLLPLTNISFSVRPTINWNLTNITVSVLAEADSPDRKKRVLLTGYKSETEYMYVLVLEKSRNHTIKIDREYTNDATPKASVEGTPI